MQLLLLAALVLGAAASQQASAAELTEPHHHHHHHHQQQRLYVQLLRSSSRSLKAADAAEAVDSTDAVTGAEAVDARAMPVYGNWCGPNYGIGTPIDELDDCCRSHDNCYDSTLGYHHCACDSQLVSCVRNLNLHNKVALMKRTVKAAIVTYFDNTACRCSAGLEGMCMPVKKCPCGADAAAAATAAVAASAAAKQA